MSPHHHHSREEIAKIEIGHTDSTPGVNGFLAVFFVLLITAVPLLQTVREEAAIRGGREPGRRWPQWADVFTDVRPQWHEIKAIATAGSIGGMFEAGKTVNNRILRDIGAYEAGLKDRDALIQWVIPRMQVAITGWLKGGNEDAYCGRDGWLFYRRDMDSLTGPGFLDPRVLKRRAAGGSELKAPPQPDPVRAIVEFRDQLAARGIALVVMPAPVKPTIHPEHHTARYAGRAGVVQNPSFDAFKARLEAEQVAVFDPAPMLAAARAAAPATPLYLKTDTHWTPDAMEGVARALSAAARRAAALPLAIEGRLKSVEQVVTNLGDVALMLKLPAGQAAFPAETVRIRQVWDGNRFWRPDPKAEVLFLGDSFANIYSLEPMGWGESAGLAEHLSLALGLPVDAIMRNDAGSYATREMLAKELRRGHDRLAGKKLVIWEFASRELACGDWKLIPMTLGERREAGFYLPPAGGSVAVRGIVRAASPAPRPGSVPYKDHIVMVHLADLECADDGGANGKDAVVFVWSMQDNKRTSASRYRPGDVVQLRLRRWADVAARYEAINRSELENDDLLQADPCWGESGM